MYAYRFILLVFFFVNSMNSMDIKEKPTFEVLDGIILANQFYKKEPNQFNNLPDDVLVLIMSQIHPRQTIDAWYSDNPVCIKKIRTPRFVAKNHIQNDSLVYLSSLSETVQQMFYLNLHTLDEKLLWQNSHIVHNFICHPTLPLCLSIRKDGVIQVYNVDSSKEEPMIYKRFICDNAKNSKTFLVWHPIKRIFALSHNGSMKLFDYSGKTVHSIESFQGKPYFSYNGDTIWGLYENVLINSISTFKKGDIKEQRSFEKIDKNLSIEEVGDDFFLTRDNSSGELALRSIKSNDVKVINSFNEVKAKKYYMPRNHDYRVIIIDEVASPKNAKNTFNELRIYVPISRARMEHYCLFKAALKAEETDRQIDWDLFKKITLEFLQQTAHHYTYFKKLMINNHILKAVRIPNGLSSLEKY